MFEGNLTGFMERLKGINPTITKHFINTWKEGSVLVENQRMEVSKDVIAEATGLGVDSMSFYKDRKCLVKISNSYFSSSSISRPWKLVLFALIEYVTLDGHFTMIYGHHFMLNHF